MVKRFFVSLFLISAPLFAGEYHLNPGESVTLTPNEKSTVTCGQDISLPQHYFCRLCELQTTLANTNGVYQGGPWTAYKGCYEVTYGGKTVDTVCGPISGDDHRYWEEERKGIQTAALNNCFRYRRADTRCL